jgi:hypothetical protein
LEPGNSGSGPYIHLETAVNGRARPVAGQGSLFNFGVRVAEKRPPPEIDRAEVERDVEAKRQARKQRGQPSPAAQLG